MLDLSKFEGHTPGPWLTQPCTAGGVLLIRGRTGQFSLKIISTEDGQLMAAAPDLLAELKAARVRIAELEADLDTSAAMLARQTVLKRAAENERDAAINRIHAACDARVRQAESEAAALRARYEGNTCADCGDTQLPHNMRHSRDDGRRLCVDCEYAEQKPF